MSKRNFILIVIILTAILVGVFSYWFLTASRPQEPAEEPGVLARFNPFRTTPPPVPGTGPEGEPEVILNGGFADTKLHRVSSMPVAGYGVFMKERYVEEVINENPPSEVTPPEVELAAALRYVDRASGNIFQTFADNIDERRFTGTMVPQTVEAYFGEKGENVIMRYLKPDERTIETFVGALPEEVLGEDSSELREIKGSYLPENITDLSVSSDGRRIFYLINSGGGALGIVMEIATERKTQVFESSFTEWLSAWGGDRTLTLTTRPSASVLGYTYGLDTRNKALTRRSQGVFGLTALPGPDGKSVLFGDSSMALSIFRVDNGTLMPTSVRTLPEKCAWTKSGDYIYCAVPQNPLMAKYPDAWYQGKVSFSDQIWGIDPLTGKGKIVVDPTLEPGGGSMDAVKLAVDEAGEFLFFVNKVDSILWELELN